MHSIYTEQLTASEKRERWQKIIEQYEQSDMLQADFARTQGLKPKNFYYHYSRWKKQQAALDTPLTFVPLIASQESNSPAFTLRFKDGLELMIHPSFDALELNRLLALLRGALC